MTSSAPIDPTDLHVPAGCATDGRDVVAITPAQADWSYAGLRVMQLRAGESREVPCDGIEAAILPVAGGTCIVEAGGRRMHLEGRSSVFARVTDFAYAGVGSEARITAGDAPIEIAVAYSRAERVIDPYRCAAEDVEVEVRGAGRATRQLTNFLAPHVCDAHRLVAVEVLTPAGNWSSWPPHKHDDDSGDGPEADLEEIYWYRIDDAAPGGFGMHRTYDLQQGWDVSVAVRDRDAFLVPRGYHGPCIASPAHDMWYLNVLAGPADTRSLGFSDDPALASERDRWADLDRDDRVPMTSADGVTRPRAGVGGGS